MALIINTQHDQDDDFLRKIKKLSNPDEELVETVQVNREAIEYLAKEIRELKKELEEEKEETTLQIDADLEEQEPSAEQPDEQEETGEEEEPEEEEEEVETKLSELIEEELTDKQLNVVEALETDRFKSTGVLKKELDLGIQAGAIQRRFEKPNNLDLVESRRNKGFRLTEKGAELLGREYVPPLEEQLEERKKEEPHNYTCLLCGKEYRRPSGFGGHLAGVHNLTRDRLEGTVEGKPTEVFNARGKTREEIKEVKDSLGEVETPIIREKDFTRFEDGEPIQDPQHWTVAERKKLIEQVLEDADQPLTRYELAQRIYNLEEKPEFGEPHANAVANHIYDMVTEGRIVETESPGDNRSKGYILPEDSGKETQEDEGSEDEEDVDVSDATHLLEEKGLPGRREFRSYKNTFLKLVHDEGMEEITYYDFSEKWGGYQDAIDAFRTLFHSPTVLNQIRREVAPEKVFWWKSKGSSGTPRDWVLKVDED